MKSASSAVRCPARPHWAFRRPVAACLALVLCSSGCSLMFVTGPPAHVERLPPRAPVECTTSKLAPAIDVGLVALESARVVYAITAPDSAYRNFPISRLADVAIGSALAVLALGSAAYGFDTASDCEDAQTLQRMRAARAASQPSRPAPPAASAPARTGAPVSPAPSPAPRHDTVPWPGAASSPSASSPPSQQEIAPSPGTAPSSSARAAPSASAPPVPPAPVPAGSASFPPADVH